MFKIDKKIYYVFLIIFIIFLIIFLIIEFKKEIKDREGIFTIERGESILQISKNLQEEEFIKSRYFFIFYTIFSGNKNNLKAGQYYLNSSLGTYEIIQKLSKGDVIKKRITIIEGWRKEEIRDYLKKTGVCIDEEFSLIMKEDFSDKFEFLKDKPKNVTLEGYLFPDTYEISDETSCRDFIIKMLENLSNKLTDNLKEEIRNKDKTFFEIIIVASLLEKEVKTLEDKKIVSGIIENRLSIGMPLQIDATIVYITGKKDTKVLIEETKIDSLYNTYLNKGLPIGPISNPGIDSIISAINPEDNQYFFYLSTLEGETIFSRTLEEHNIAKNRYLK